MAAKPRHAKAPPAAPQFPSASACSDGAIPLAIRSPRGIAVNPPLIIRRLSGCTARHRGPCQTTRAPPRALPARQRPVLIHPKPLPARPQQRLRTGRGVPALAGTAPQAADSGGAWGPGGRCALACHARGVCRGPAKCAAHQPCRAPLAAAADQPHCGPGHHRALPGADLPARGPGKSPVRAYPERQRERQPTVWGPEVMPQVGALAAGEPCRARDPGAGPHASTPAATVVNPPRPSVPQAVDGRVQMGGDPRRGQAPLAGPYPLHPAIARRHGG
jgi:hypothetical protein